METTILKQTTNVNEMSLIQLVEFLTSINKPTFCYLVTETNVRMNKTNNPYYNKVTKLNKRNVMIGTIYENRVNNNRTKEDKDNNFVTQENKVGEHLTKILLYNERTQKYYLQYEIFEENKPLTEYLDEHRNPIEYELFKDYLVKSGNYSNQGLERSVNILSVTLNNIKELHINGKIIKLVE